MTVVSLSRFLLLYGWFALAALLMFLLLIARFYQRVSGEKTYYGFFALPIILFGIASVRYASINQIAGDTVADLMRLTAGVVLAVHCLYLYRQMTRD